jgi:hypothetical protein
MARALGTGTRFLAAYLVLGVAAGASVGTAVVLAQRPGPKPPPPWSRWRPVASSVKDQVLQIADHVGPTYRFPNGNQMTTVKVNTPSGGQSLRAIGIPTKAKPKSLSDFKLFDSAKSQSVFYALCGDGDNCKISEGAPSQARGAVLRREALELALYTFEYSHPVENVIVFFPPGPGEKKPTSTLFFRRSDLSGELDKPLRKTLPEARPPLPGRILPAEQQTVDDLTGDKRYRYDGLVTAQGYGRMVVLKPGA